MREKIYNILNKIYGVAILVSLFGGVLPLIQFIVAMIIGGDAGANISVFLYKKYYPWVAVFAAVAVLIGIAALYIGNHITFKFPKKSKKTEANREIEENTESNSQKNKSNEGKDYAN